MRGEERREEERRGEGEKVAKQLPSFVPDRLVVTISTTVEVLVYDEHRYLEVLSKTYTGLCQGPLDLSQAGEMGNSSSTSDLVSTDSDDSEVSYSPPSATSLSPIGSPQRAKIRTIVPLLDLREIVKRQEPVVVENNPRTTAKPLSERSCFDTIFCIEESRPAIETSVVRSKNSSISSSSSGGQKHNLSIPMKSSVHIDWGQAASQVQGEGEAVPVQTLLKAFVLKVETCLRELDDLIYGGGSSTPEEMAIAVSYDKILKTTKKLLEEARRLGCTKVRDSLSSICTIARAGMSRKGTNLAKSQYLRICSEYTVLEKCKNGTRAEIDSEI